MDLVDISPQLSRVPLESTRSGPVYVTTCRVALTLLSGLAIPSYLRTRNPSDRLTSAVTTATPRFGISARRLLDSFIAYNREHR